MAEYISSLPGAVALGLIWGIMAIGVYITYKILDFADLTVDGSMVTGAAVCAVIIVAGGSFWLGMLGGFVAGLLCGLLTSIFHTILGIPPILSGILTQLSLWSVNLKIMGSKSNISVSPRAFKTLLAQLEVGNALWKLVIICAIVIGLLYLFFGTELGFSIRATGNNPTMAKAQGINTQTKKVIGLMLSNGLVALSGALLCQYQGFTDINMGRGAIVIGLCAVVIGEVVISKISSNFAVRLMGVVIGAIIYYIVFQSVVFLGLDTDLLKMLSAIVVAVFLGVPYLRKHYGKLLKPKKAKLEEVK